MTQIMNMVLDKFVEHFTSNMITNLSATSLLRADVVKKGLLQEEKIEKNIQIGITGGDHDNPDETDAIVTLQRTPDIAIKLPPREIGGGQFWMRRGVIRLECFYIAEGLDEDEAHAQAYDILGRVMGLVEDVPVSGLVDTYGESTAMPPYCYANTFFEAGGPPSSYIFRGKIFWAIYTERP